MNKYFFSIILVLGALFHPFSASVLSVRIESTCPYSVNISWIGNATKGFNIYRSILIMGTKEFLGSVNWLTKKAVDETAKPNQTYYYYVEAVDDNATDMSVAATARVPAVLGQPFSPTATIVSTGINISWIYIDNEDGVKIYRSTNNGQYLLITTIANAFTSSWIDIAVLPGNTYSYKIVGYNECGESDASLSSSIITIPSLPDLDIDSFSITVRKDSLYGRFIVANISEKTAIMPFKVGVLCNDSVLIANWETDGNLLGGYYIAFTFKYKTKYTQNRLYISADYTDVIEENSELNNFLIDTVYAAPVNVASPYFAPAKNNKCLQAVKDGLVINTQGKYSLDLFDLTGKLVLKKSGFNRELIKFGNISEGTYLVVLRYNDQIAKERIFLKR